MLCKSSRRKYVIAAISVLSILLITSIAFAVTRLIRAESGGTIALAPGVWLVIPPGSLEEDTPISVTARKTDDGINFIFGPSGTTFDPPAKLCMTWQAIYGKADVKDLEGVRLYNENGDELEAKVEVGRYGVVWHIPHFSLYYYRRR
jgi:hypothetical protein